MSLAKKIIRQPLPRALSASLLLALLGSAAWADSYKLGGECIVFDYDTNFPGGTRITSSYGWSGGCDSEGFASGFGELQAYWNGRMDEISTGTMVRGRLEGQVVTTSPNGSRFEGTYNHGHRTGWGVYTRVGGGGVALRYEGQFVDGLADGFGALTVNDNLRYEGGFLKGRRLR